MSEPQYNLQFEKLCDILQLGKIVDRPEIMTGGLLHRMYAIKTTQGKYAIKALNPSIISIENNNFFRPLFKSTQ